MKWTVNKKEIDFAVVSEKTRVPFCMLDLSPSPPGGLSLFFTFQKERPATNKSVADPGEGPGGGGGVAPSLCLDQTAAPRAKRIFLGGGPPLYLRVWITEPPPPYLKVWIQHCKYYYFICLALRLTCKKLKNNCISLNLFHFNAVQIHCSVFGVRSDINASKKWAVSFVKRFVDWYLRLLLCQGFFKL